MPRMSPRQREEAYQFCVKRDGEKCRIDRDNEGNIINGCARVPVKVVKNPLREVLRLDVDHVDGNKDNNPLDGSNWALKCHSCNCKKNSRGAQKHRKFSSYERFKLSLKTNTEGEREPLIVRYMEMAKSLQAKPIFFRFMAEKINELGKMKVKDLCNAGAKHYRNITKTKDYEGNTITAQAIRTYVDEETNPINGEYETWTDADGVLWVKPRTNIISKNTGATK